MEDKQIMVQRLDVIDFLKGFSIFTIVVMHLLQYRLGIDILDKALSFGGAGVHVFLLCSGFGLYLSHLKNNMPYPLFLRRRFFKVYVPYIIVVLISLLIPFYWTSQDKAMCLFSHVFLFKMFFEQYESSLGIQMWFVSTIIQFYLCWPLIARLFEKLYDRSIKLPIVAGCVISLIWTMIVIFLDKSELRIWNSFFLQYIWEFMLGMFLAKKYAENNNKLVIPSLPKLSIVAVVCLGMTAFAGIKGGYLKLLNDAPSLFSYLSIALILYKLKFVNGIFKFTNQFSYEWYLVHILIFSCTAHFMSLWNLDNNIFLVLICEFIFSYLGGYLYSLFFKKMRLK